MSKRQASPFPVFILFWVIVAIVGQDPAVAQVRFDEPVNLSKNHAVRWSSEVAAAGDQVLVYWLDYTSPAGEILAAHSNDRGKTFRIWYLSAEIPRSYPPRAVTDEENVYVAWLGFPDLSDLNRAGMYLARSNDRGESFLPPYDITGRGGGGHSTLRLHDRVVNIAWLGTDRYYESGLATIFFAKSSDFGETFSVPVLVPSTPQKPEWSINSNPELAFYGDDVYMAWEGGRPGLEFNEIYFGRSTDGGKTFYKTINLSNSTEERGMSRDPQLGVSGKGNVNAAWAQGRFEFPATFLLDVYFASSSDGGQTFGERLNLSKNPQALNRFPRMVTASDNMYVVWSGLYQGRVLFSRSTDGGKTFTAAVDIARNPGYPGFDPQMAVIEKGKLFDEGITEDVIYLVWYGGSQPNSAIFFSVSLDGGVTFTQTQSISNPSYFSAPPRIAAVGRNVYVTWRQGQKNSDAIFIRGQLELEGSR